MVMMFRKEYLYIFAFTFVIILIMLFFHDDVRFSPGKKEVIYKDSADVIPDSTGETTNLYLQNWITQSFETVTINKNTKEIMDKLQIASLSGNS